MQNLYGQQVIKSYSLTKNGVILDTYNPKFHKIYEELQQHKTVNITHEQMEERERKKKELQKERHNKDLEDIRNTLATHSSELQFYKNDKLNGYARAIYTSGSIYEG